MGRLLTGVTFVLSAAHRDQVTLQVHGHTWEITAWFVFGGNDQALPRKRLMDVLLPYDHTMLPDKLAWGEAMALHVATELNNEPGAPLCVAVDVLRPSERIMARWEA